MGLQISNPTPSQIIIKPTFNGPPFFFAAPEEDWDKTVWCADVPQKYSWWHYNESSHTIINSFNGRCLTGSRSLNILGLRPYDASYAKMQRFEYLNDAQSLFWIDPNDAKHYAVYPHKKLNKAFISPNPRGSGPYSTLRERLLLTKKLKNLKFGTSDFMHCIVEEILSFQPKYRRIILKGDEYPCFLQANGDDKRVNIIIYMNGGFRTFRDTVLWCVDSRGYVMHYLSGKELRVYKGNHGLYRPVIMKPGERYWKFTYYKVRLEKVNNDKDQLYFVDSDKLKYVFQNVSRSCKTCGVAALCFRKQTYI